MGGNGNGNRSEGKTISTSMKRHVFSVLRFVSYICVVIVQAIIFLSFGFVLRPVQMAIRRLEMGVQVCASALTMMALPFEYFHLL